MLDPNLIMTPCKFRLIYFVLFFLRSLSTGNEQIKAYNCTYGSHPFYLGPVLQGVEPVEMTLRLNGQLLYCAVLCGYFSQGGSTCLGYYVRSYEGIMMDTCMLLATGGPGYSGYAGHSTNLPAESKVYLNSGMFRFNHC